MKPKSPIRGRALEAEQLERREVLSVTLTGPLAMPPDALATHTASRMQDIAPPIDGECTETAAQSRDRIGENATTGDRRIKRSRDLDSQNASPAVVSAVPATPSTDIPPQQRARAGENSTTGDGRLKRPRDRDSQNASLATGQCAITASLSVTIPPGAASGQQEPGGSQLTVAEKDDLLHLREEEKLARDVYLALGTKWNVPIFANIAISEQQHMDAVAKMIDKYGLEDPVVDDTPGKFTNPQFSALYEQLVQDGSASVVDAYKVGAMIEEMDIVDLREALADTTHTDIQSVYENLMRGSRNHLRAFAAELDNAGASYVAQYLTQEEFDAIALSPPETGGNQRRGSGRHVAVVNPPSSTDTGTVAFDYLFKQIGRGRGRPKR